jgi:hypothetical protein
MAGIEAKDIVTFLIAAYGATVASIMAYTNRGKLKVEAAITTRLSDPYMTEREGDSTVVPQQGMLRVTVTNTGKRPIRVTSWGVTVKDDGEQAVHEVPPLRLPTTLAEAESVSESTGDLSFLDLRLRAIWAEDSRKKKWKLPRRIKKSIVEDRRSYTEREDGWYLSTLADSEPQ